MIIAGIQRFSLIDYPGKISAVLFTQGCPFRCHFCHNPSLVDPLRYSPSIPHEEIFQFLHNRIGKLDGIVISGGEPTMHKNLCDFLKKVKEFGFSIKLDTNGISPEVLKEVIEKKLIDFIAMDIKGPLNKYSHICGVAIDPTAIEMSITLIKESKLPYEFRSTLVPFLHDPSDIEKMAQLIQGANHYILQKFVSSLTLNPSYKGLASFSDKQMQHFRDVANSFVRQCLIR